jgi:catalase
LRTTSETPRCNQDHSAERSTTNQTLSPGARRTKRLQARSRDRIEGDVTRRKISLKNDFAQADDRYRSLSTIDQDHLIDNVVDSLEKPTNQCRSAWWITLPKQTANWAREWLMGSTCSRDAVARAAGQACGDVKSVK